MRIFPAECSFKRLSALFLLTFLSTGSLADCETRVLIGNAPDRAAVWRYTTVRPSGEWASPEFDDRRWNEGKAGFGVADPFTPKASIGTPWTMPELWLRKAIDVAGPIDFQRAVLRVRYDEDVRVYVNSKLIFAAVGYNLKTTPHDVTEPLREALSPGRNVVAAHVRQTSGGQYVDLGLVLDPVPDKAIADLRQEARHLPPIACVVQHRLGNPQGLVRYHAWPGHVVTKWGCRIQIVDPARPQAPPKVVFEDPQGAILDMNVSYDAKTLFFSFRRQGEENWHLFEIGVDGNGLRQITTGPFSDFSPEELPGGELVFSSTRVKSFNICAQTLSTALFAVRRDDGTLRQVTMNTLNDLSPHVLPNGQLIYMRWEYVDRDVTWRQSLWTVNPDGTNMQLYFGNTVRDPAVFWQARPIPGRDAVVATFAPHHGWPLGAIGIVTRRYGVEAARGVGYRWITQELPVILDNASQTEWAYRDPMPINDHQFLVSYGGGRQSKDQRFKIYLLDDTDRKALVWEDRQLSCIYPLPLTPREMPNMRITHPSPEPSATGTFILQDVYAGLGESVQRGEIKYLRVLEQPPKFPVNESSPRVYDMTPVMGQRCYYRKRCLGIVPVEADGSAHFTAPAFRELYFQALDAQGRAVQSMGSAVTLAPGETQTCVGCHDDRNTTPPSSALPTAAKKPPVAPKPYAWGNDGFIAFPVVVQPVLDEHCVNCHSGPTPEGRLDLSGDHTRFFSMAYDSLWDRGLMHSICLTQNDSQVIPPKRAFSYVSKLRQFLEEEHYDVQLSKEERERFYVWMDANSNYYGTHQRTRPGTPGGRDLWADPWFGQQFMSIYREQCVDCHGPNLGHGGHPKHAAWINLTHPEHSAVLTAHLAKEAGGWGIETESNGKRPPAFETTDHPTYQALLAAIRQGHAQMRANPRVDMPGSTPKAGSHDWGQFPGTR